MYSLKTFIYLLVYSREKARQTHQVTTICKISSMNIEPNVLTQRRESFDNSYKLVALMYGGPFFLSYVPEAVAQILKQPSYHKDKSQTELYVDFGKMSSRASICARLYVAVRYSSEFVRLQLICLQRLLLILMAYRLQPLLGRRGTCLHSLRPKAGVLLDWRPVAVPSPVKQQTYW